MPLRITNPGQQAAVLNKWADGIEQQLAHLKIKTPVLPKPVAFKTNNVNNPSQNVLNIKAGANITVTQDPFGGVIISSTSATDGLVHGSIPWETDPTYVALRDDFIAGNNGDTAIGELRWHLFGSNSAYYNLNTWNLVSGYPQSGAIGIYSNSTSANTIAGITMDQSGTPNTPNVSNRLWPVLDYPGWKMTWIFCYARPSAQLAWGGFDFDMTKVSSYVGLANAGNIPTTRPNSFIGARFDTDTTSPSIGDSTIHLEACFNAIQATSPNRYNNQGTGGGTFDTGITPIEGAWYRLDISCVQSGKVEVLLNGVGTTFTVSPIATTLNQSVFISTLNHLTLWSGTVSSPSYTTGWPGFGAGSKATLAGQPLTILQMGNSNGVWFTIDTGGSQTGGSFNVSAYPALLPVAMIGNDSQGTAPTAGARGLVVDFFSFVWNPGLIATVATDTTKPRFV